MTNSRLTDPEVLEWRFPVMLESFAVRAGSGGGGALARRRRGRSRRLRFLEPMTAAILSNNRQAGPFGLAGGAPGAPGRNTVVRADGRVETLAHADTTEVAGRRRVLIVETPGGGGWGTPGGA